MKLYEGMELLNDIDEDLREILVVGILNILTDYSCLAIRHCQEEYDGSISLNEFFNLQNRVILECVKSEMSNFGKVIRSTKGLEPLTRQTEIELE